MKKSIFIIAALLAATISNAQITYERTFDGNLSLGSGVEIIGFDLYQSQINQYINYGMTAVGEYIWDFSEIDEKHWAYNLLDANTLSLVKSFIVGDDENKKVEDTYFMHLVSRGIFTTDGKWAGVIMNPDNNEIAIVTEDGNTIAKLPWEYESSLYRSNVPFLLKTKTTYKLVVPRLTEVTSGEYTRTEHSFDIYSLPGNGEFSQDVIAPVAPRNARKVLKKDQVLVESADKTYTLQGQEVK